MQSLRSRLIASIVLLCVAASAATSLQDSALRASLTTVAQTALRDRPGIEGGLWQSEEGPLAYAYPTYHGAGPKTDMPQAEVSRIQAINAAAQADDQIIAALNLAGHRLAETRERAEESLIEAHEVDRVTIE